MSDRICILGNHKNAHISAENLVSCCGDDCGYGCEGGYPDAAWTYWVDNGIVTGGNFNTSEGCQPYSVADCGIRSK